MLQICLEIGKIGLIKHLRNRPVPIFLLWCRLSGIVVVILCLTRVRMLIFTGYPYDYTLDPHEWSYLLPEVQRAHMDSGCIRLETVAWAFLQPGWMASF
jgi:hypothetical protein